MQTSLFTTAQSAGTTASPTANGASSPSDLFTKLLVAQIRNQNPLEPSDPSQFVNQLTQLSQMESLQQLASQSSASATMLQGLQMLALGAQVGSRVTVASDRVVLGQEPVQAGFTLENASARVTLVLTGPDGSEQRLPLGTRGAGEVRFAIDPAKLGLAAGTYSMRVETDSKEAPAIEVTGDLAGVKVSPTGGVVLNVAQVGEVLPAAITQYNGRQSALAN